MLVAAAVCPQTPLLVPEVAAGAAEELEDVRKASLDAVTRLLDAKPELLLVLAPTVGAGVRQVRPEGTFRRFGVDVAVGGDVGRAGSRVDAGAGAGGVGEVTGAGAGAGAGAGGAGGVGASGGDSGEAAGEPCCGLLVGRWLLEAVVDADVAPCEAWEIGEETAPDECARLGRELGERCQRAAFLVMADGSARRTLKAPGYLDERAEPFDDAVARALADADVAALAAIDPMAASEVMAAGRAPWQVLAGAAQAAGAVGVAGAAALAEAAGSGAVARRWRGDLLSYQAPYGVGYFTALWTLEY